jgi:hypothetical protein
MTAKNIKLVLVTVLLSGCVDSNPPPMAMDTKEAIQSQISTTTDQAVGGSVTRGPYMQIEGGRYVLSRFSRNGATDYAIDVTVARNEWAFYNQAFADGKEFEVTVADRMVGDCSASGCIVGERIRIHFTRADLLPYREKTLNLALIGTRHRIDFVVPSIYTAEIVE